jgi:hypothetical protein
VGVDVNESGQDVFSGGVNDLGALWRLFPDGGYLMT